MGSLMIPNAEVGMWNLELEKDKIQF